MKKYIVVGLESTGTRIVSQMIANNLGIIKNYLDWDPYESDDVFNDKYLVTHQSLPHAERDNYIGLKEISKYDYIILTTRDWNCSLISKINNHQPDFNSATDEHKRGIVVMKNIINSFNNKVYIFSLESAVIFQSLYVNKFLKQININFNKTPYFYDLNKKYIEAGI